MSEQSYRCTRCGETKPSGSFTWRVARNRQDTLCRACRAEYGREHYLANRERYIAKAAERTKRTRRERTEYLLEYFEAHPCVDCGETDAVVLEFDHLRDKAFDIGPNLTSRPWSEILEEIEKCDTVCANCHRRRTAERRGALRSVLQTERAARIELVSFSLEG